MIPDHELVSLARTGDSDAFCALLERHRIVALRLGYTIAGGEAEDAVQKAMVKAFRHLDRFHAGSAFRPWFLAIVANEARNPRGSWSRQDAMSLRLLSSAGSEPAAWERSSEDGALALEQRDRLLAAVAAR